MDLIDRLLEYMKTRDKSILVKNVEISDENMFTVAGSILYWLKLEHREYIQISQGQDKCFKPLLVDAYYPWYADLYRLIGKEKLFHDYFAIRNKRLDFRDNVSEEERIKIREKVYREFNLPGLK